MGHWTPRSTLLIACLLTVSGFVAGLPGPSDAPGALAEDHPRGAAEAVIEPGLLEKFHDGPRGIIAHFDEAVPSTLAEIPGIQPSYAFQSIPAAYVLADAGAVGTLGALDAVTYIEDAEKPLALHLDSATVASRAREVFDPSFEPPPGVIDEPSPTLEAPDGSLIDGAGVGIAVVDSGLDGTHPDFTAPGKQGGNFLVTPEGVREAGDYTVQGSPHGTFVAGNAAGTGAGSDGIYRGAAPGATLYTFATWRDAVDLGQGTVLSPAIAFDWILAHGGDQDPPIRVVVNAWTCDDPACNGPEAPQAHLQLARGLADAGFVVAFSVGNGAGEGLINRVTPEAQLATPGILGVGAADDEEVGNRDDCAKGISSRGDAFEPATWPDLLAPGDSVWSPNAFHTGPDTRVPEPTSRRTYEKVTSTSASVGHLGGIVALVLQANPTLEPGEVEHILETTAHKMPELAKGNCPVPFLRADPANLYSEASFAAGHGLVDAMDAVETALSWSGLPDDPPPSAEPIPLDYPNLGPAVSVGEGTFYLEGEDGLSPEAPTNPDPRVRVVQPGTPLVHTTHPFEQARTLSAAYAEVWVGTAQEYVAIRCGGASIGALIQHVDGESGKITPVGSGDAGDEFLLPGGPWLREVPVVFNEPVTFEHGDRLRMNLQASTNCLGPLPTGVITLYSDADDTPSRLLLGQTTREILPDTFEACQVHDGESDVGCAWIGGQREVVPIACQGVGFQYEVSWFGPPGSGATVNCHSAVTACIVPGEPGDAWGQCEASSLAGQTKSMLNTCQYFTVTGEEVAGEGFCRFVPGSGVDRLS